MGGPKINFPLQKFTEIYIVIIVKLHGIPSSILLDRDLRFTSRFWESLHEALGIKLRLSSACHPHTDGQNMETIHYHSSIGMKLFEALYGRRYWTPLCWYESRKSVVPGPEIVQQTTEKVKMVQEKMVQEKMEIFHRIGVVAYRVALPPSLSNLHEVFNVSHLRKYIPYMLYIIQMDDVQVRGNLIVEALPIRIEDQEVKQLRGKEIALVKVVWGGPTGGSLTW
ncbi:uncharacterized protein LOC127121728 [Lathyrus oleraceus]|uniref:uncharacterized protein LOC127121728 n=1 Tax=Pisum sativum TaxID=3888 RepID=UPI0021D392DD|nr:uncharacterized protein LOC127121728 [Pisum sativum]